MSRPGITFLHGTPARPVAYLNAIGPDAAERTAVFEHYCRAIAAVAKDPKLVAAVNKFLEPFGLELVPPTKVDGAGGASGE